MTYHRSRCKSSSSGHQGGKAKGSEYHGQKKDPSILSGVLNYDEACNLVSRRNQYILHGISKQRKPPVFHQDRETEGSMKMEPGI